MTLIVKHGNTFKFLREETTNLLIWCIFNWSMIILLNVFFKKSINVINLGLIKVQLTNGWKIASHIFRYFLLSYGPEMLGYIFVPSTLNPNHCYSPIAIFLMVILRIQ